jgi:hypothetical protein
MTLVGTEAADMTTATGGNTSRDRTSSYLYLGSLYLIAVGLLYLWGYWPTFGINILEYMNLTDILKLTAYPLVSSFVFLALGVVAAELVPLHRALPPGGGRDTRAGRILHWLAPFLAAVYIFGTLTLLLYGSVRKWRVVPALIAVPVYVALSRRRILASLLPNDTARFVVLFLLTLLPPYAYGWGKLQAASILNGSDYQYLAGGTVEGVTVLDPNNPKNRVKYLGHVNDYVFLLLPDNTTSVVVRFDKVQALQLRRFRAGGADIDFDVCESER